MSTRLMTATCSSRATTITDLTMASFEGKKEMAYALAMGRVDWAMKEGVELIVDK